MKKIFINIIMILLFLVLLISCGDKKDNNTNSDDVMSDVGLDNIDTPEVILKPDLPEKDMGGKNITVLTSTYYGYEPMNFVDISPGEFNGEVLNDAAYERKLKMEQEYNMTITHIEDATIEGSVQRLKNSVLAADGAYDFALIRGRDFGSLLSSGVLLELNDMPYMNLDMPWWEKKSYDGWGIGKKHYGVNGSISVNEMLSVDILCFNKSIIKDYGMESPYNLVKSGDWTWGKAVEMAKQVSSDLDGDGKMTKKDFWGINYTTNTVVSTFNNCGVRIAEYDENGVPVITLNSAEYVSRMQNILIMLFDQSYSFDTLMTGNFLPNGEIFGEGRCLFMFAGTHDVKVLRAMDIDFGIIPYPKYDTAQKEYIPAALSLSLPVVCVPKTNADIENTGLFMEAFAYEGYTKVVPAFYDTILMGKLARDSESEDMLEYIFGNIDYDPGNLFNFGDIVLSIGWLPKHDTNIASFIEKNMPVMQRDIDKIMNAITEN